MKFLCLHKCMLLCLAVFYFILFIFFFFMEIAMTLLDCFQVDFIQPGTGNCPEHYGWPPARLDDHLLGCHTREKDLGMTSHLSVCLPVYMSVCVNNTFMEMFASSNYIFIASVCWLSLSILHLCMSKKGQVL